MGRMRRSARSASFQSAKEKYSTACDRFAERMVAKRCQRPPEKTIEGSLIAWQGASGRRAGATIGGEGDPGKCAGASPAAAPREARTVERTRTAGDVKHAGWQWSRCMPPE